MSQGSTGANLATGDAAQTTVYSYQTNRDPKGLPRENLNSATAQNLQERFNFTPQLAQAVVQGRNPRYQNLAALLNVRPQAGRPAADNSSPPSNSGEPQVTQMTLDWLAKHSEEICLDDANRLPAKININTASHEVLKTLPGMNDERAEQIISSRSASGGVFNTLGDVLDRRVLEPNVLRGMLDKLTVRSDVFTVESVGVSGSGVQERIIAVIDRGSDPVGILYWCQTQ